LGFSQHRLGFIYEPQETQSSGFSIEQAIFSSADIEVVFDVTIE